MLAETSQRRLRLGAPLAVAADQRDARRPFGKQGAR